MVRALAFLLLLGGCGPAFHKALTPSGEPCADMPVMVPGDTVDKPYHRIGPVKSAMECTTEAERLESLRRVACKEGADAIIEARNEESRLPDNRFVTLASGTAIVFTRARTAAPPLNSSHAPVAKPTPAPALAPSPAPAPAPAPSPAAK
jgi:hypothetical protein